MDHQYWNSGENDLYDPRVTAYRGEIYGFWLWCDIKGYDGTFYVYCQRTDPLIEAVWTIANTNDLRYSRCIYFVVELLKSISGRMRCL